MTKAPLRLAHYGLPPYRLEGASSYGNHQTGDARAILHADVDFSMRRDGNLYGSLRAPEHDARAVSGPPLTCLRRESTHGRRPVA